MIPFCSLPGEALTPLLQAPAGQEHQLSLHAKWPKSPVPSLGFPGRWPVVKLKINISLASSAACPTLDNSCKGLTSPWRCNPSIKMTTFGPRHPGRCRMDKKQNSAQIFLIPAYPSMITVLCFFVRTHLIGRSQSARGQTQAGTEAYTSVLPLCWAGHSHEILLPQQQSKQRKLSRKTPLPACPASCHLPPAQAEPLEPWDVPALACTTVTASCSSPSLLLLAQPQGRALALRSCSLCTHRISAPKLSKGSFALQVESSSQH